MKYFIVFFLLFFGLGSCIGQTIRIDSVSGSKFCAGATFSVFYSTSGKFDSVNIFRAQISDSNGVFTDYPIIAESRLTSGSLNAAWYKPGSHYRIVIFSNHPITESDTSPEIQILPIPGPKPLMKIPQTNLKSNVLAGETLQLEDTSVETVGSTYYWNFGNEASIIWSTTQTPTLSYPTDGMKTVGLTVTNPSGCSTTQSLALRVLSCTPLIPFFKKDSLFHICSKTESGYQANVWVKAGGNFTSQGQQTIFVEPGGTVQAGPNSNGLYYLKKGAVFIDKNSRSAVILLNDSETVNFTNNSIDTFYCNNLQFDYSQVSGDEVKTSSENHLQIQNIFNGLHIRSEGEDDLSVSVVNIFGIPVFTKTGRDEITFALNSYSNGVYFAIITCGHSRVVKKITVVH